MTCLSGSRVRLRQLSCSLAALVGLAATAWAQGAGSPQPAAAGPKPLQRGAALLHQACVIAFNEPLAGRCHVLELEAAGGQKGQRSFAVQLRFVHGAQGKFALKCKLPMIGELWIGQASAPWMVAGGKTVLLGAKSPIADRNPLGFADPQNLKKLQMVNGLITTFTRLPDALGRFLVVEDAKTAAGGSALRVSAKQGVQGNILVSFQKDGKTPAEAVVSLPKLFKTGIEGKITIHDWRVNETAQDAWFAPPADLATHEVDQADLYHVFSAMFDLAMERTE
jgi:hypothetical protein